MTPRDLVVDTFRSLRIRNYRLFTAAQLVSLSGTWMQTVAQNWLVLGLTESGIALGVTTGLQFLPTALLGLWGGVMADRVDKRRILIGTQAASGTLAVALGVLTATGGVRIWMVYLLAFLLGIVLALDTPARQAFVIEMVGEPDVANAVGINSAVFNGARIIGPALAGVVIATAGLAPAFLLNGVSYVAPVAALVAMDPRALHQGERASRRRGQVRRGLRYAWTTPEIRRTLLLLAVVATLGFNFTVTVPMLARYTFGGGATAYAILSSVAAAGGLAGALWTARRARPTPRLLAGSAAIFGVCALSTAFVPTMGGAAATLALTGGAAMAFIATANSTLQLRTPARLRGRIMALYALVFLGSTPLGGPLVGWISGRWGARAGIGVGGVAALVAAGVALRTLARARRPETTIVLPRPAVEPAPGPAVEPAPEPV